MKIVSFFSLNIFKIILIFYHKITIFINFILVYHNPSISLSSISVVAPYIIHRIFVFLAPQKLSQLKSKTV